MHIVVVIGPDRDKRLVTTAALDGGDTAAHVIYGSATFICS